MLRRLALTLLVLLPAAVVLAQEAEAAVAFSAPPEVVTGATAILAWLFTYGLRKLKPTLPRSVVYATPFLFSIAMSVVTQLTTQLREGTWQAVLAGVVSAALAIAGNEGKTTVVEHGVNG
jgi:hypothetical protein